MVAQPVSERARLWRSMGLAWLLAPIHPKATPQPASPAPTGSSPQRAGQKPPRPTARATQSPTPATIEIPGVVRVLFHGKQFPLHSLWTYIGLWEDLREAYPPRLGLLKKIQAACVQHLGWDSQRMALWPCHDPALWRHAFTKAQPRWVLIFGQHPEFLDSTAGASQILLPDLDPMIAGDSAAKARAWETLRHLPQALDGPARVG